MSPDGTSEPTDRPPRLAGFTGFTGTVVRGDDGVIDAMAGRRASMNPSQLVNRVPLVARLYESAWRVRSLGLLAGRPFPIAEELAELDEAVGPALGGAGVAIDVACSEGLYGRHLAEGGADVALVDHSVAFLRRALGHCDALGVRDRVDAVRALADRLPWADASVDATVMGGSLNEIGDEAAALREMVRVLRPGGRLFCMSLVPSASRLGRVAQALAGPSGIRFPTAAQTVAWLGPDMRVVEERCDGVVLRITAEKTHGNSRAGGHMPGAAC